MWKKTGIGAIGDVPTGTHLCLFYETAQDLVDILTPFFRVGLEVRERCLWVAAPPLNGQAAEDLLESLFPGALSQGQLKVTDHTQHFLTDGAFEARAVMAGWRDQVAQAQRLGYSGLRVVSDVAWLNQELWHPFYSYEQWVDQELAQMAIVVLCCYPLTGRGAGEVLDMARTHHYTWAKRDRCWEVLETSQVKASKAELYRVQAELEGRVGELEASNRQLRTLTDNLRSVREEESARIGRELHDELGSALTSLRWDLEELDKRYLDNPGAHHKIAAMTSQIEATINSVRRISSELRPVMLDDLGLVAAIEWQAQQFAQRSGCECRYHPMLENVELSQDQATAVFRILQEALTNILRHAGATQVNITLEEEEGTLILEVQDNGIGIAPEAAASPLSLGLLGMRERAERSGGSLSIGPPTPGEPF